MAIGRVIKQSDGYSAFIPDKFPTAELLNFTSDLILKSAMAERLIGKLDGISHVPPMAERIFIRLTLTFSIGINGQPK